MTKILILNDLHIGETHESSTRPSLIRQANNEALETLEKYIPLFNNQEYDLVINLGDLISDVKDHDKDLQLLRNGLSSFAKINYPKIFIPGNHELRSLTYSEMKIVAQDFDTIATPYGLKVVQGIQCAWTDVYLDDKDIACLPEATIAWLQSTIDTSLPTIFFSHFSCAQLNGQDNFYFHNDSRYMSYTNGSTILELLSKCPWAITINAHTHMATYTKTGVIPSVSALSFTENIAAMKYPDANPGIYSVLEITDSGRFFRSYSGEFCFLCIEL